MKWILILIEIYFQGGNWLKAKLASPWNGKFADEAELIDPYQNFYNKVYIF